MNITRLIATGFSLFLISRLFAGIHFTGWEAILFATLILTIINSLIRPLLIVLTIPISFITLGLFLLVINGFCFYLTAAAVPGFTIYSLWDAFWGAIALAIVNSVLFSLFSQINNNRR